MCSRNATAAEFRDYRKFSGETARISIGDQEIVLLKPTTYMNRSGLSIRQLSEFYKIAPDEILVAHDELDLPVGSVRLKHGGGHGGHNGLRDTIAHIGDSFWRLRLGIGHPGNKTEVIDYVLTRAPRAEEELILDAVNTAADCLPLMLEQGAERAMTKLHSRAGKDLMPIRCGIVGLPNVGKSTSVQCADARANRGGELSVLHHRSERRRGAGARSAPGKLAAIVHPERILPTTVEFVDIAGLVAGASKGEGLGNKFLAHIREVDAIAHVVRCFENDDIIHVAGKIDPASDIEVINTELALADLDSVERAYQKAVKAAKTADKDAVRLRDLLERVRAQLNLAKPVRLARPRCQRAGVAARSAPADRQARDVRRQRRRERFHQQSHGSIASVRLPRRKARSWCRFARPSRRRLRSSMRPTAPIF